MKRKMRWIVHTAARRMRAGRKSVKKKDSPMIAVTGSRMRSFFTSVMPCLLLSMSCMVSRWIRVVRSQRSRRCEPRVKQNAASRTNGRQHGEKYAEDAKPETDEAQRHKEKFFQEHR